MAEKNGTVPSATVSNLAINENDSKKNGLFKSLKDKWNSLSIWTGNFAIALAIIVVALNFFYADIKSEGLYIVDIDVVEKKILPPVTPSVTWSEVNLQSSVRLVSGSEPKKFCGNSWTGKIIRRVFTKEASSEITIFDRDDHNKLSKLLLSSNVCDKELNIPKTSLDIFNNQYLIDPNTDGANLQITWRSWEKPTSILGEAINLVRPKSPDAEKSIIQTWKDKGNKEHNIPITFSRENFPEILVVKVFFKDIDKPLQFEIVSKISTIEKPKTDLEDKTGSVEINRSEKFSNSDLESENTIKSDNEWRLICKDSLPNVECSFDHLIKFWRLKSSKILERNFAPYYESSKVFVANTSHKTAPFLINMIYPERDRDAKLGMEVDLINLRYANPEPHELDNEKTDLWFSVELSENSNYHYEAYTSLAFTPKDFPEDCARELSKKRPLSRCQFYYRILFDVKSQDACQEIKLNSVGSPVQHEDACVISRIFFERLSQTAFNCNYGYKYGFAGNVSVAEKDCISAPN